MSKLLKNEYCLTLHGMILWCTDLLQGNNHETNETMAVARQHSACNNGSTVGGGVFYVACSKAYHVTNQVQLVSAIQ
jgi:hypothetical protein